MTISNFDLVKLAETYKIKLTLTDVISSNHLINIKLKKFMNIIINLESSEKGGSHWVLLIIRDNLAFYFDSFGASPDNYVIKYCSKFKLKLAMNNYIIQDLKSTECGIFCLGLLVYIKNERVLPKKLREFKNEILYELCNNYCNMFSMETKQNDKILYDYLNL